MLVCMKLVFFCVAAKSYTNFLFTPQIEGLLDDEDFKAPVTRAEFEELCTDLFDRISKPVKDALKASEVTWVRVMCSLFSIGPMLDL